MDIAAPIAFIEAKGSILEKARLDRILYDTPPSPLILRDLEELQNDDGGFPFGMHKGNLSTINETTVALWWLEELDLISSPCVQAAFTYLLSNQKAEGGWDEDPRIGQYDLPDWIQLGDPRTRLYLSAYATYWLAVGGYDKQPGFRRAVHFLIRNQDRSGEFYGYLHTTWIATAALLLAGERYAQVASLGLQYLSTKPLSTWADSQIAWALDCLSTARLPSSHPFVERCLRELSARQNPDGSWASEDGEVAAVGATIQALKVLKRYAMLSAGF